MTDKTTDSIQLGGHEARIGRLEKDVNDAQAAIRQVEHTEIANMAIIQKDIATITTDVALVAQSMRSMSDKVDDKFQEHDEKFDKIMDKLDKLQEGQVDFRITKGKLAVLATVTVMAISGGWEVFKFIYDLIKH
jgi:chromosome segregation ATPase